jgi:tRNA dimethylallyltransferase
MADERNAVHAVADPGGSRPVSTGSEAGVDLPVVVVVGPTASGKSDVAISLAEMLDGEVVSADSMQIYRRMDIGTGKVPVAERRVPHFGLDICDPGETYSASRFQAYARDCFADIERRGKLPILAGGTGFYVRAAIDDYDFSSGEQDDNPVREKYQAYADEHGGDALWELLRGRDPESAAAIHPHNVKRVIRALEMLEYDQVRYADRLKDLQGIGQRVPAEWFGLAVDREALYARIDARVDAMFEQGLVQEVEGLVKDGFRPACTAQAAIGYKEVVDALEGGRTMEQAREDIKRATRRYAKRQMSWWRKDSRVSWIDANSGDAEAIAGRVIDVLREKGCSDVVCRCRK